MPEIVFEAHLLASFRVGQLQVTPIVRIICCAVLPFEEEASSSPRSVCEDGGVGGLVEDRGARYLDDEGLARSVNCR